MDIVFVGWALFIYFVALMLTFSVQWRFSMFSVTKEGAWIHDRLTNFRAFSNRSATSWNKMTKFLNALRYFVNIQSIKSFITIVFVIYYRHINITTSYIINTHDSILALYGNSRLILIQYTLFSSCIWNLSIFLDALDSKNISRLILILFLLKI